jgi:hypothetical protein
MTYLKIVTNHVCKEPQRQEIAKNNLTSGTIWQCDECKKVYKLEYDQRDGWIWMEQVGYIVLEDKEK